jgi:serine phosphatase RsbU (regulator of sigma subunit)
MQDNRPDATDNSQEQLAYLKQQNELLKSQLMNTSLIDELTKVMHSITDLDKILNTLLLGIHEIAGFDRIILFDINKDDFTLVPKSWFGITKNRKMDFHLPLGFEGGEITDAIFLNKHLLVENSSPQEDFFYREFHSKSYIVIPLVGRALSIYKASESGETPPVSNVISSTAIKAPASQNISENERRRQIVSSRDFKTQGVFWMDRTTDTSPITSDDITILSSILTQGAIIIENLRMYNALEAANNNLQKANSQLKIVNQDLRTAQDKINKDLDHARTIQQGLLPQNMPESPSLTIKATYIPAIAVGGDYYDAFEITPGVFGMIVADVSGHGVASALIMSMVKVLLKTYANSNDGPKKTLEKINTIFQTEVETSNFVTVFYGVLDTNTHNLYYSSAGHCPVLLFNKEDGAYRQIKADGLFLGIFPDMMLSETCYTYKPGTQRLILYTDGLTEARNEKNEMFDLERLTHISLNTLSDGPGKAYKKILNFQKKFCGKNSIPDDDITLLIADF